MKIVAGVSIVLLGYLFVLGPVRAADSCTKECREDYRACKGAHSEGACRTNYDICVKHCKK
jgi:hypothetical protein